MCLEPYPSVWGLESAFFWKREREAAHRDAQVNLGIPIFGLDRSDLSSEVGLVSAQQWLRGRRLINGVNPPIREATWARDVTGVGQPGPQVKRRCERSSLCAQSRWYRKSQGCFVQNTWFRHVHSWQEWLSCGQNKWQIQFRAFFFDHRENWRFGQRLFLQRPAQTSSHIHVRLFTLNLAVCYEQRNLSTCCMAFCSNTMTAISLTEVLSHNGQSDGFSITTPFTGCLSPHPNRRMQIGMWNLAECKNVEPTLHVGWGKEVSQNFVKRPRFACRTCNSEFTSAERALSWSLPRIISWDRSVNTKHHLENV